MLSMRVREIRVAALTSILAAALLCDVSMGYSTEQRRRTASQAEINRLKRQATKILEFTEKVRTDQEYRSQITDSLVRNDPLIQQTSFGPIDFNPDVNLLRATWDLGVSESSDPAESLLRTINVVESVFTPLTDDEEARRFLESGFSNGETGWEEAFKRLSSGISVAWDFNGPSPDCKDVCLGSRQATFAEILAGSPSKVQVCICIY